MDRPGASRVNKGKRKATTQESPSSDNAEPQHHQATRSSARPTRGVNSALKRGDCIFHSRQGKDRRASHGPGTGSGVKNTYKKP